MATPSKPSDVERVRLRDAAAADAPAVQRLIDGVYREYGERLCLDNADADLLDLDSYRRRGGQFVVLEHDDGAAAAIIGSHAVLPIEGRQGVCTFRRLYLAGAWRGSGLGDRLMRWALDWARGHGMRRVEFWSDTRFQRAHRFFQRFGFAATGETRRMHDGFEPYDEFFFATDLAGSS